MTRVALIVTGDAEFAALHRSLQRAFPTLEFVRHASPPGQPMDGFTSNRLRGDDPVLARPTPDGIAMLSPLAKLIDQLVLGVHPGRNGVPYDHAVLIDDLELDNTDQPERVVAHVRAAIPARIDAQWPSQALRDRVRATVRERCSFHLLCPMLEGYFFCDEDALDRAGRVAGRASLVDGRRIEDFAVDDPTYAEVPLPEGATKRTMKSDWRRSPERRARHPKKYLQYLCDPSLDGGTRYDEATTGAQALSSLAWPAVLSAERDVRFVRSLFADLARIAAPAVGVTVPDDLTCAPPTARFAARDRVLRNV